RAEASRVELFLGHLAGRARHHQRVPALEHAFRGPPCPSSRAPLVSSRSGRRAAACARACGSSIPRRTPAALRARTRVRYRDSGAHERLGRAFLRRTVGLVAPSHLSRRSGQEGGCPESRRHFLSRGSRVCLCVRPPFVGSRRRRSWMGTQSRAGRPGRGCPHAFRSVLFSLSLLVGGLSIITLGTQRHWLEDPN